MQSKKGSSFVIPLIFLCVFILIFYLFRQFFGFGSFLQNVNDYQDTENIKYHWTGLMPFNPETCSVYSIPEIEFTQERIINTGKSEFKFVITDVRHTWSSDGQLSTRMRYDVHVYKDGVLIDKINGVPVQEIGSCNPNWRRLQQFYRAYSDSGRVYIPQGDEITPIIYTQNPSSQCQSGTYDSRSIYFNPVTKIKLPNGETGINVIFGAVSDYGSACGENKFYVIHRYEIISSSESFGGFFSGSSSGSSKISLVDKIINWFKNLFARF